MKDNIARLAPAIDRELQEAKTRQEKQIIQHRAINLQSLLKNIIDSMPSVIVGIDSSGKVTQWNIEAEKETGLSSDNAEGLYISDAYPQLKISMDNINKSLKEKQVISNSKIESFEGEEKSFSDITIYPLIGNRVEGAVIRKDDITEKVRIEEMMIQSEKMLSVGGLAAGMAHEINNPLAGILQNLQVISNRLLNNKLPSNQKAAEEYGVSLDSLKEYMESRGVVKMMQSVRESGTRAAKIIDNMLSFSRMSEAMISYISVNEILEKTIELANNEYDLKMKYDFRKIEILREYTPDIPEVPCEVTKIQQVFLNLLKNGAHAMSEDKNRASKFIIRSSFDEVMVRMEIEDNGLGMDSETTKRIFEPFFTTKGVGKGTGLGLSVSYFIITENHNGYMGVESIPGKGTTFIIELPRTRKS